MGSGIGAVRVPEILQSVTQTLEIAGSANLQIDLTELPLANIEQTWTANTDRNRIVYTTTP